MLDLNLLSNNLSQALNKETPESLSAWLQSKRKMTDFSFYHLESDEIIPSFLIDTAAPWGYISYKGKTYKDDEYKELSPSEVVPHYQGEPIFNPEYRYSGMKVTDDATGKFWIVPWSDIHFRIVKPTMQIIKPISREKLDWIINKDADDYPDCEGILLIEGNYNQFAMKKYPTYKRAMQVYNYLCYRADTYRDEDISDNIEIKAIRK